ncbi:MAG: O-antigen ligase family protein [Caldimonas sp.]
MHNLKPFIVVFVLACLYLWLAKPIFTRFIDPRDYVRRRNVWLLLTVAAFLLPSFWIYVLLAAPVLFVAGRRDSNPIGVYAATVFVIPPLSLAIPVLGINQLFDLTQHRLLALTVLLPAAFHIISRRTTDRAAALTTMDWALLAYGALQVVLLVPYESVTNTMRRAFLFGLDTLIVFYVVSRIGPNRRQLVDTLATFVWICGLWSAIALFETFKGWLLYEGINQVWGAPNVGAFLLRGNSLRSQVSAGHSLNFGYLMALGFSYWLYLRQQVPQSKIGWSVLVWVSAGLIASYSRAPWLAAVICIFVFLALHPGGASAFFKGAGGLFLVVGVAFVSGIGSDFFDRLPFIGTIDQENVEYRQRLAETSWTLIQQNPYFGNPFAVLQMESLRQGSGGIIDLVNAYANIALFYGLVTLAVFAAFALLVVTKGLRATRRLRGIDNDLALLGGTLVGALIASLFFIATALLETSTFVVAALVGSFIRLAAARLQAQASPAPAPMFGAPLRPFASQK